MFRSPIGCKEFKFHQVPCPKPDLYDSWKDVRPRKTGGNRITKKEKEQRENCKLSLTEYEKPSDKKKYLFVNDQERVGAKRTSYLDNVILTSPAIGKKIFNQGYHPEIEPMTHGMSYVYENGVARCLGEWQEMEPSPDPKRFFRDHITINKNCQDIGLTNEREFSTYRDNIDIWRNSKKITGRRDQTLYYPKGATFGRPSEERDCLYEILGNQEQAEWVKERKKLDEKVCEELIEELHQIVDIQPTRTSELRSKYIYQHHANPPEKSPRPLTRLRMRSKPKVSTTWNVDEVLGLLHNHAEADYRVKHFALPSKHNLYYNKLHNPEELESNIVDAPKKPMDTATQCIQCKALKCTCHMSESEKDQAKGEPDNLASEVMKGKHVIFNDVVEKRD